MKINHDIYSMRKKWRLNIKIPTRSSDKVWKFGVSSYNDNADI